ncbi:MAG: OsmC family protein [Coriobacteriia bacterium]|nr:OsmC family protein [Coriobacteriia bacterium]MBN2823517.1 OsmC family protein [Coriobacteriia bacterium]
MDAVKVKWNGGRRFVGWDEAGHGIVMDASAQFKGDGSGARPLELVLYALGGCTGIDIIAILEKQRQTVSDFELVITAEQREEQPRYYERINIEYVLTGVGLKASAVERAISLSEDKYCSVKGMFGPGVSVTTSYRIVEV